VSADFTKRGLAGHRWDHNLLIFLAWREPCRP
jgi:hypothetical protein